ncbi:site-2 protease family protein [Candidatus Nomurabacteria bacterium]|nr:site-2 protease family protein [Candidatus Nomurabacteria bacterium]
MQPLDPIFLIVVLVMSVVIHEVSHGYVADLLGDPTARLAGRLTLNPLKHLDWLGSVIVPLFLYLLPGGLMFGWAKPVPYNPYNLRAGRWGPAYVALAGPASNLLIALIFGLSLRNGLLPGSAVSFVATLVLINLMLAMFNLIPIPPLDGSKVLFAVLPNSLNWLEEWWLRHQLFILIIFIWLISSTTLLERLVFGLFRLVAVG